YSSVIPNILQADGELDGSPKRQSHTHQRRSTRTRRSRGSGVRRRRSAGRLGDVLEPEGRQLASELGDAATFLRQDVTQEGDWKTAVNAAEKLGGLHGLVNNAGFTNQVH